MRVVLWFVKATCWMLGLHDFIAAATLRTGRWWLRIDECKWCLLRIRTVVAQEHGI